MASVWILVAIALQTTPSGGAIAKFVPPVPTPASFISDERAVLKPDERAALDARITQIQSAGLGDIAVAILPSIGSYFGDKVANSLGLDVVQIETSGSTAAGTGDLFSSTLANTRFGGGVQIGSRTFIRANLGLCPFAQQLGISSAGGGGESDRPLYANLFTSIGAKLEYRLSDSYSASVGLDPATKEVLSCASRGATPSNFVTTPPQFGLDFTRKWEF